MEDWERDKGLQALGCCELESSMASAVVGKSEISFEVSTSVEWKEKIMDMMHVYLLQLSNWIGVKYLSIPIEKMVERLINFDIAIFAPVSWRQKYAVTKFVVGGWCLQTHVHILSFCFLKGAAESC